MRRRSLTLVFVLLAAGTSGCIVPEDMPALREELGYASVEVPDLIVRARASTLTPVVEEPVTLTAETEGMPADRLSFTWTVEDTSYEGASIETSFPTAGTKTVELEAVGPNGTTAGDAIELQVAPNTPPQPNLVIEDEEDLLADEPVVFRATGSMDPDGDALSYDWQIDGESVSEDARFERSLDAGPHEVELTVTDGHASRTVSKTFAVHEPIRHEANLSVEEDTARFTLPVATSAEHLEITMMHTTHAGLDDVDLAIEGPDGTTIGQANEQPDPGEAQGHEKLEVPGGDLEPEAHTLVLRLENGIEATATIEGVLTYSPLPEAPG